MSTEYSIFRCTMINTPEGDSSITLRKTAIFPDKFKLGFERVLVDTTLSDETHIKVFLFKEECTFKEYVPSRYMK